MRDQVKSKKLARLSAENAERLASGLQPKGIRGRLGVYVPGVTEMPALVDIPLHRYASEAAEGRLVQGMAIGQWWRNLLLHIPMEGGSGVAGKIRSAQMKGQGARKGISDYLFAVGGVGQKNGETKSGLWIELKASDGKPSDEQLTFIADVRAQNYAACIAYGADAVITAIRVYLAGDWPE